MASHHAPGTIWLLIAALGVGTYAFRLSFIHFQGWIDDLGPRQKAALSFVPPAILAALVFPELFPLEDAVVGTFLNARAIAGGAAFVVAWRTGSMVATIGGGMVALWLARFLIG